MAKYPIRIDLTKTKPMASKATAAKPAAPKAASSRAATQATLDRAARMQGMEERSESLLLKRRPAAKDTISVVTRMRETPAKKGR